MSKHIVVAFGRANPITAGHEKLFDKVASTAKEVGGEGHIHLSQSHDNKKNPLDHDTKVHLAKEMMPHHAKMFHNEKHVKTFFDVLKHHSNPDHEIHVIAGSDRVEEYKQKLNQYNGKDFHYKKIHVHSAGDRDPDADGSSGISGTKMRAHAHAGDFESFKKGAPSTAKPEHIKKMYDAVRSNPSLKEGVEDMTDGLGRKSFMDFLSEAEKAADKLSGKKTAGTLSGGKTEVIIDPEFATYQQPEVEKPDPVKDQSLDKIKSEK